jgi:hypothetical protein
VELSSKVDATRSVAVLASGLLAVRMANAVVGHTISDLKPTFGMAGRK